MIKFLFLVTFALSFFRVSIAQKKVVVIGSSTAAGMGASDTSKTWVNLIQRYWGEVGEINTPIINLAIGGLTTYHALPIGYVSPLDPRDGSRPPPLMNESVTTALSFNPDVVIVSFVSNDIGDGFSKAEYLFNLRVICNKVIAAGKICYITSTQPRTEFSPAWQDSLLEVRDSILPEFAPFSLDFYSPVVNPDSLTINPLYAFGDGIHLNDAGHQKLFQVVQNNVILSNTPLALSLTSFTARQEQHDVQLQWTDAGETGPADFEVQRSATGSSFDDLQLEKGQGTGSSGTYSWTDDNPLPGASFYRLKITDQGKESYSQVVSVGNQATELILDKILTNTSDLIAEIGVKKNQSVFIVIMDRSGALVSKQTHPVSAPYSTLSLPLAGLAAGEYFLKITAANGYSVIKPFVRF